MKNWSVLLNNFLNLIKSKIFTPLKENSKKYGFLVRKLLMVSIYLEIKMVSEEVTHFGVRDPKNVS